MKNSMDNPMARISFTFGMLAMITAVLGTIIFPFVFGGLAVVFSSLSRGYDTKFRGRALKGLVLGIVALILNTGIFIYQWSVFLDRYNNDFQYRREMNEMFDQMQNSTGVDPRDYLYYFSSSSPDSLDTFPENKNINTETATDGQFTL